jgi:hypothetical protein
MTSKPLNWLVEDRDTQKDTAAEIDGMLMKDMNEVDMKASKEDSQCTKN